MGPYVGEEVDPAEVGPAATLGLQRGEGLTRGDQVEAGAQDGGRDRIELDPLATPPGVVDQGGGLEGSARLPVGQPPGGRLAGRRGLRELPAAAPSLGPEGTVSD